MTKTLHAKIGPRDIEILTAIDRFPMTPAQLCHLSQTFESPFQDENNLRRRLRVLTQANLVQSWPYAIAGDGRPPRYFKLTRDGYRMLHGTNAALPKRRYFQAIRPGHHHHTFSLSELLAHLIVSGHRHGCVVESFARENSVRLDVPVADEPEATTLMALYPDCSFAVRKPDGRLFSFMVELDNGTERIRSPHDLSSIERKLRGYDAHQSQFDKFDPARYLVLFVTTRSEIRVKHILDHAASVMRQPNRTVFLGCDLHLLKSGDPFRDSLFQDHRGLKRALVPLAS